jgi:hypothetical protein
MPQSEECLISIDLANALRAVVEAMGLNPARGDVGFRCRKCSEPVKPVDTGTDGVPVAHFRHLDWESNCPLHREKAAAS